MQVARRTGWSGRREDECQNTPRVLCQRQGGALRVPHAAQAEMKSTGGQWKRSVSALSRDISGYHIVNHLLKASHASPDPPSNLQLVNQPEIKKKKKKATRGSQVKRDKEGGWMDGARRAGSGCVLQTIFVSFQSQGQQGAPQLGS